jgi:protein NrfC
MSRKRNSRINGQKEISRRAFLKFSGTAVMVVGSGQLFPDIFWPNEAIAAIAASEGYLLVDTKKCQGCLSCMLACSLVHEGVENLSLARIQVLQDSFRKWPDDLTIEQCRQCIDPTCVEACPTGALHAEARFGQARMIDPSKCNGCKACLEACSFEPARVIWNPEKKSALKCDLCANTPFHWDDTGGGPKGKQACVAVCPVQAIKFTAEIPEQMGDAGYKINLRGKEWRTLGYPTK